MASGNLGLAVFVDAVLLVLTFVWAIIGTILTAEGALSISDTWVLGPFIALVLLNILIFLFAYFTSKVNEL